MAAKNAPGVPPTGRQAEVLDFIRRYWREHAHAPSWRQIMDHFGFASTGSVICHLVPLRAKGLITYEDGTFRTVRPTDMGGCRCPTCGHEFTPTPDVQGA